MIEIEVLGGLLAAASLGVLGLSLAHLRDARATRKAVSGTVDYVKRRVEIFERLEERGGFIVNMDDVASEWAIMQREVKEMRGSFQTATAHSVNCKTIVNVFHEPRDHEVPELLTGVLELLEGGFHLVWIYSSSSGEFAKKLTSEITARHSSSDLLAGCRFRQMTAEEERLPVNFAVVAPFVRAHTVTYVCFPGDEHRDFALRIREQSMLAGKLDTLALNAIREMGGAETNPSWKARIDLSAAVLSGNAAQIAKIHKRVESEQIQ